MNFRVGDKVVVIDEFVGYEFRDSTGNSITMKKDQILVVSGVYNDVIRFKDFDLWFPFEMWMIYSSRFMLGELE